MSTDIRKPSNSDDQSREVKRHVSPTNDSNPSAVPVSASASHSFAEVALRLGGASDDEARRTGVLDTADDQVEGLFAPQYQTVQSPAHRAVWDAHVPTELFQSENGESDAAVDGVIERSLQVVRSHRDGGTLVNDQGKITDEVLDQLGEAGYWGMLVDREFGGSGASMRQFSKMITAMATLDPTVAGLASVHGCIGAVDPVRSFGSDAQKRRFLPKLADGTRLSAFALTEPGAGSDLTALRTTAVLDGDDYVVNGEKLFITNAVPGRTIGLVCKIDGVPSVLVVDLPESEDETFQINRYEIYALRRAHNNGLVFRNFRVPAKNRLVPAHGDGLTIAYHGLNLGRVALCANAAGTMRWMLAEMLPWADYRHTYGQAIARRELVQRRIGRMAGLIVACDALSSWCSGLLDQGYRGEMECIIAKIFGSEAQKEAAIELFMKTHGGRSFLAGHLFGDNVHEFLAPCIYEGEGEMLGMAFFKSLVKDHGKRYFEPIGRILHQRGIQQPNLANPRHLWALKEPMMAYAQWYGVRGLGGASWTKRPRMSDSLARHAKFAQNVLSSGALDVSGTMRAHQLKLADRQCRMSALSSRLQDAIVMLVTALYANRSEDPVTQAAGNVICSELRRRLSLAAPSDRDFRQVTRLGATIASQGWNELKGVGATPILMPYSKGGG
ncbi:Acyl-CoA dehydrogenase [Rubripirellula lacrimiformis]|uniref:Acyl-CoA dehydrogenase n=1 Tax=Rubripirellula lacrimiformis TaxID=1930273 RepID=A0A517N921_9BACT|nr:acyl-CoA dehydrogenase family protein [Rubripirellula lacrimiformis]QDT03637.1 Acyl-CoA dehydrogenase [Rubripirellula lacrimiformis]